MTLKDQIISEAIKIAQSSNMRHMHGAVLVRNGKIISKAPNMGLGKEFRNTPFKGCPL
jgi:deoxycytidylate deaminase